VIAPLEPGLFGRGKLLTLLLTALLLLLACPFCQNSRAIPLWAFFVVLPGSGFFPNSLAVVGPISPGLLLDLFSPTPWVSWPKLFRSKSGGLNLLLHFQVFADCKFRDPGLFEPGMFGARQPHFLGPAPVCFFWGILVYKTSCRKLRLRLCVSSAQLRFQFAAMLANCRHLQVSACISRPLRFCVGQRFPFNRLLAALPRALWSAFLQFV